MSNSKEIKLTHSENNVIKQCIARKIQKENLDNLLSLIIDAQKSTNDYFTKLITSDKNNEGLKDILEGELTDESDTEPEIKRKASVSPPDKQGSKRRVVSETKNIN